ncbi:IS3 family transposase [Mycoavidus sp. B2-EB]|uniref:IS3 family transposase n=1 Tax=Mycoavidus sp. B2-EB TaxID=2651972 RepID=UPI0016234A8E
MARSTFYYQLNGSQKSDKHTTLKEKIQTIFAYHKERYGYPRITSAIRQKICLVNHTPRSRLAIKWLPIARRSCKGVTQSVPRDYGKLIRSNKIGILLSE